MASRRLSLAIYIMILVATPYAQCADSGVVDVGSRRELFVDRALIDRLEGAQLVLHEPRPAERVIKIDRPWEGPFNFGVAVWKDGDLYRMYYRGLPADEAPVWCIAESTDGVHWTKPDFGLVEMKGIRKSNVVGSVNGKPLANLTGVFLNARPETPPSDRYIGIAPTRSPPGRGASTPVAVLRWRAVAKTPGRARLDDPSFQRLRLST